MDYGYGGSVIYYDGRICTGKTLRRYICERIGVGMRSEIGYRMAQIGNITAVTEHGLRIKGCDWERQL